MSLVASVVFPYPLDQPFVYGVPEALAEAAKPGVRVLAPLGRKNARGFIVAVGPEPPAGVIRVKDIIEILDAQPLWSERFLSFARTLSAEYKSSWGEMLQASLPPSLSLKEKVTVSLTTAGRQALETGKLGPKDSLVAALLVNRAKGHAPLYLQRKAGVKDISALMARMERKGLLAVQKKTAGPGKRGDLGPSEISFQLGLKFPAAAQASDPLGPVLKALDERRHGAFYLSGARPALDAAFLTLVRRGMARAGRVLFLVPEVALTKDFLPGFVRSLGRHVAIFHGRMTPKQKEDAWRSIRIGRTPVIVGTRSALFLDPGSLRLIIVDDEHDESYIQAESPSYDARRGAMLRARSESAAVVFGSPRPSVEAYCEAEREGALIKLGHEPARSAVTIVDHRTESPVLSPDILVKVRGTLARGGRVILFLNRRGYAASPACASCGRIPRCRRCDIPMVLHKKEGALVCHYCGESARAACPECGGRLVPRKGAGTEALEEELKSLVPEFLCARLDADTTGDREARDSIVRRFSKGRIPLLIGTQLLAHQPGLAPAQLVGIVSPEILLGFSDYRASQRTLQTVAGMMECCENSPAAEVVIQTPSPPHFSIQAAAAGDYGMFYEREISFRRLMGYPPFMALAEILLQGRDVRTLAAKSRDLKELLQKYRPGLEVLGPAFASVVRLKDMSRIQFILKAGRRELIDKALSESLPRIRLKKTVVFSYSLWSQE